MLNRIKSSTILILLGCYFCVIQCQCSAKETYPANIDPGALNIQEKQKPFEDIVPAKKKTTPDLAPLSPKVYIEENLEKIQVNKIIFSGNTIIKTEELDKFTNEIIGKEVTLKEINDLIYKITKLYFQNGYVTSFAFIPEQTMQNGILEIKVVESTIGDIKINGAKWIRPEIIENKLLKVNNVAENKVFNIESLNESINKINNKSYLKSTVSVQKGENPGETDILLKIQDKIPLNISTTWNNTGSENIGIQKTGLQSSLENILTFEDRIFVNNSFSNRLYGVSPGYSIPLGNKGTEASVMYSFMRSKPGGQYQEMQMEGISHSISASINQPIIKKNNFEMNSIISFDVLNSKSTIYKNELLNNYDTRVLRTGISFKKYNKRNRMYGNLTVSTGLPIMGATDNGNSIVPDSRFVKINPSLTIIQTLPWKNMAVIKTNAQFATSTLFSSEQLALGGFSSVRGYEEGSLYGDYGYNCKLEIYSPVFFLPKSITIPYKDNKKQIPIKENVNFVLFYDNGWAKNLRTGQSAKYTNFLQSIGTGFRIKIGDFSTANFDLGIPLGEKRYENQNSLRFHFYLNADII